MYPTLPVHGLDAEAAELRQRSLGLVPLPKRPYGVSIDEVAKSIKLRR